MALSYIDKQVVIDTQHETDAQSVYQLVRQHNHFADFARHFAFSSDHKLARNALWCLTKATSDELRALQPMLDNFIDQAIATPSSAVRRLSLNIVERLAINADKLRTDFLDFCLMHMVSLDQPPGVQAVCMKLAYRMCSLYPELNQELLNSLKTMEPEYYNPAVLCVRNRILSGKLGTEKR